MLSARVLARALNGRGVPAVVSSVAELPALAAADLRVHVALVAADGDAKQVEQTCHAVRQSLPDVELVLLLCEGDQAPLVRRGVVDGVVSRACGLDGLIATMSTARGDRPRRRPLNGEAPQHDEASRAVATLTPREKEVLRLMATGAPNHEVALRLAISPHTVRTHVQNVLAKLGAENRLAATAMARRAGLLPAGPDAIPLLAGTT